ncbi:MAG: ABC transporter substrate-binding protein [Deltaproteobacteria bacterium]|nr:ABC transporter substrate-binding protein [Deltaproteobacteria bacterium]
MEGLSKKTVEKGYFKGFRSLPMNVLVAISVLVVVLFPCRLFAGQTEIRFVTWKPQIPQVWDQAIADFEAENPGIKIVREVGPHSTTEFHDLVTQKLKNRDPEMDVFFMDVIWPAEFAAAGWALPLNRFFPAAEQKKFLVAPILANTYRGRIYGVPLFIDAGMLYYRKDLLRKYGFSPPSTWPELVRQAKTILAKEKDPHLTGFSGQFKQYEGLICDMMEYILSNGGSLWDEKRLRSTLHLPKAKEAVRFVRDQIIRGISHRGVLAYQEPESLALFTQGKAIFHRNWPYAWEIANDPERSKVPGKVGMVPLPAFPGGKSVATLGGWQLAISRFSRKPELAWKFVAFMSGREIQKRITLFTGRAPARKELYRDPDILKKYPQFRSQLETFVRAVPRPRTAVYTPMSNIMQRFFSSAIAVRDSDIDELARLASRDIDRVLDLLRERIVP